MADDILKKIIAHSKEYGFIFQSSEIYDGLSAVYDYGQNGSELKNNIKKYWWDSMVRLNENIVGIDAAIFMHPTTWKASGHLGAFSDPLIDNKDSKKRYRADVLVEDFMAKIEAKIEKEVTKAKKRFGDSFDEQQFRETNPRVLANVKKLEDIKNRLYPAMDNDDMEGIRQLIIDLEIADPISGTKNWTEVRQFNLMFSTSMGSTADSATEIFLRPETAQGIFVNYLNVQKTTRMKIPFGIAQTGKAFRNEIVARQFIFRMREFEQMEMQFFVKPGDDEAWLEKWRDERFASYLKLGIKKEKLRIHQHAPTELAHYAKAAYDIEYEFPFGWQELEGIHNRTDFDLKRHAEYSGKDLSYFVEQTREKFTPYIIETSAGLNRTLLVVLVDAYDEDVQDGEPRTVLRLHPKIAPTKVGIFSLVKKSGLPEIADKIAQDLRPVCAVFTDHQGSIGRRYRRMDEIGTPWGVTVDHQTLEDQSVTLRDRDTLAQERVNISDLPKIIREKLAD